MLHTILEQFSKSNSKFFKKEFSTFLKSQYGWISVFASIVIVIITFIFAATSETENSSHCLSVILFSLFLIAFALLWCSCSSYKAQFAPESSRTQELRAILKQTNVFCHTKEKVNRLIAECEHDNVKRSSVVFSPFVGFCKYFLLPGASFLLSLIFSDLYKTAPTVFWSGINALILIVTYSFSILLSLSIPADLIFNRPYHELKTLRDYLVEIELTDF